eukprot:scaffold1498_cov163-Amphora_coffeaeformis.AAC.7
MPSFYQDDEREVAHQEWRGLSSSPANNRTASPAKAAATKQQQTPVAILRLVDRNSSQVSSSETLEKNNHGHFWTPKKQQPPRPSPGWNSSARTPNSIDMEICNSPRPCFSPSSFATGESPASSAPVVRERPACTNPVGAMLLGQHCDDDESLFVIHNYYLEDQGSLMEDDSPPAAPVMETILSSPAKLVRPMATRRSFVPHHHGGMNDNYWSTTTTASEESPFVRTMMGSSSNTNRMTPSGVC